MIVDDVMVFFLAELEIYLCETRHSISYDQCWSIKNRIMSFTKESIQFRKVLATSSTRSSKSFILFKSH